MNRRRFFQTITAGSIGTFLAPFPALAASEERLVILHTNDTHSRIDPFPSTDGRFAGLGGAARRATLIKQIRQQTPNVLLLDSGDVFQGTPYFNFFKGEVEFKTMSAMQYDFSTLGNHEFDNGVKGLVDMMPHASFDFVSANYKISNPSLKPHVKPYAIKQMGSVKVGIFGLGIDLQGLVLPSLHEGVVYTDPIIEARSTVDTLRNEGCDLVICLSHMGYRYRGDRVSDTALAQEVSGIDLILGGHTHSFIDAPDIYEHKETSTIVNQVGFAGIRLGRVDLVFNKEGGNKQRWFISDYQIDRRLDLA